MKRLKKIIGSMLMAAMLCMMMTTTAFAAEGDLVWLSVSETSDGTDALIVTNTTVTDGLVKVTYDSSKLTYQGVTVSDAYVAMYAANAEEAGIVLISWVAPEAYETEGDGIVLIGVNFTGTAEEDAIELTGKAQDADGNEVAVGNVDETALEQAIAEAESLKEEDYTADSFAAMEEVLAEAKAVLEDPSATQSEIDAATEALNEAMDALVSIEDLKQAVELAKSRVKEDYTEESYKRLKDARSAAEKVLNDPGATQEEVDKAHTDLINAINGLRAAQKNTVTGADNADTGDNANIVLPAMLAVAALIVLAAAVFMKKRGLAK